MAGRLLFISNSSHPQDHQEIEWQFDALDVRPVGRWLEDGSRTQDPLVAARETREISDTYLDTEDWRMHRAGYALRVRSVKGRKKAEATMKLLTSENCTPGLRSRREISETLEGDDPEALNDSTGPVGERVRSLVGPKTLHPLFGVETRRNTYALTLDGSEAGEIALDETAIPLENGEEPAQLRRVEVEVEPEALSRLEPFVGRLRDECRLSPSVASKFESGLFALGVSPPGPPEFGPTHVDESFATGELAFRVLRRQFAIFLAHEPGTRIGEDSEGLHDMRVTARRMRAAIKIFEDYLPVRARKFRDELKWVAGALGEVRDLDVQLERLEGWASGAAPEDREALRSLRAVLEERRAKKRKAMLRTLNSRRYANLVESFGDFLKRGPSRKARNARRPILEAAPDLVRKPYRKVRKLGDPITEEASGEQYHELRKKGKRLRYALEFLLDIYGESAGDLIKALKTLQDVLGDHQDAEVARAYLRELGVARGRRSRLASETIFVMGGVAERYRIHDNLSEEFPKAYDRIKGKRWKRLKKEMENLRPQVPERGG